MIRTIELKRWLTNLLSQENKITYYQDSEDSSDSEMEEVPFNRSSSDDLLAKYLTKSDNNVIIYFNDDILCIKLLTFTTYVIIDANT